MGLRENEVRSLGEFRVSEAVEIVSLDDAGRGDGLNSQVATEIGDEVGGLVGKGGCFFDKKTVHNRKTGRIMDREARARGMTAGDWRQDLREMRWGNEQ